jgi:tetratricopeptide (TPR) repeat protein
MVVALQKTFFIAAFFTSLFFSHAARAQAADTLALAQQLTAGKEFGKAAALLARYEQAHPINTDAARLHLQLLYWQHQLPEAAALYQRTSRQQPAATNLQLDYGRILYETKQYSKARAVLGPLLQKEPGNVETLTMLGIMAYNENQLPQAVGYLNQVLATYPDNPTAKVFAQKIKAARAPFVQLSSTYRADDQLLRWLENKVEAGSYRSPLLAPTLQAMRWSTRDSSAGARQHFEVLLGNKGTFLNQKLTVQLNAGVFKHAAQSGPALVGCATSCPKALRWKRRAAAHPTFLL